MTPQEYTAEAVSLLKRLIATPSVSRDETAAADIMEQTIRKYGYEPHREGNNVWAVSPDFQAGRPTILLNAHIDTVRPVASYTRDPFTPSLEGEMLYGLGANDDGGSLIAMLAVFMEVIAQPIPDTRLIFTATAEEEVSGKGGIERLLPLLPPTDVIIVGEPTSMQMAVAEKGLLVFDALAQGKAGHAARNEGVNAIYEALDDLVWLRDYRFRKVSPLLGETKMTVTVVEAGTQHNVIPDSLHFVIDIRTNEYYQNEFVYEFLRKKMKKCRLEARSFRLHSSSITESHPLIKKCKAMGMRPFGSPTLSDQALMPFPSFKLGPGKSARSHSANEYIRISEIKHAIETYVNLLSDIRL